MSEITMKEKQNKGCDCSDDLFEEFKSFYTSLNNVKKQALVILLQGMADGRPETEYLADCNKHLAEHGYGTLPPWAQTITAKGIMEVSDNER